MSIPLEIHAEVSAALQARGPVVALESSLITHGLPFPINLETAMQAEAAVRGEGGVPATIAVLEGRLKIGLSQSELAMLAEHPAPLKASRRDLAAAIAQRHTAGTTVAASIFLAHRAGIRVFATGGIGGVHRDVAESLDISADLTEVARTPVCVVCSGAKSVLDIAKTLEMLETLGVPVIGYGVEEFPAFYVRSSGQRIDTQVTTPADAARLALAHWELGGGGVVLAQPPPAELAFTGTEFQELLAHAQRRAAEKSIHGKQLTPFLLRTIAELSQGRSLELNQALVVANARLAASVARLL
jgi:pseudouridine-5'-phosphate glycosidase